MWIMNEELRLLHFYTQFAHQRCSNVIHILSIVEGSFTLRWLTHGCNVPNSRHIDIIRLQCKKMNGLCQTMIYDRTECHLSKRFCAELASKYFLNLINYCLIHVGRICCQSSSNGYLLACSTCISLIVRFMGPTWGPSRADRTQVGTMLTPWTLLSGPIMVTASNLLYCRVFLIALDIPYAHSIVCY